MFWIFLNRVPEGYCAAEGWASPPVFADNLVTSGILPDFSPDRNACLVEKKDILMAIIIWSICFEVFNICYQCNFLFNPSVIILDSTRLWAGPPYGEWNCQIVLPAFFSQVSWHWMCTAPEFYSHVMNLVISALQKQCPAMLPSGAVPGTSCLRADGGTLLCFRGGVRSPVMCNSWGGPEEMRERLFFFLVECHIS